MLKTIFEFIFGAECEHDFTFTPLGVEGTGCVFSIFTGSYLTGTFYTYNRHCSKCHFDEDFLRFSGDFTDEQNSEILNQITA